MSDRLVALEQLDDEAVAALLARLPQMRAYLQRSGGGYLLLVEPSFHDLARLLASEYGAATALDSCSITARQLIVLAAWHGAALSRTDAIAATGDLEHCAPGALDAAAAELRTVLLTDAALGFVHPRPGVEGVLEFPGVPVRSGVQYVNSDEIARWLFRLTGQKVQLLPTRKPDRVTLLETVLRDRPLVEAALARLPAGARPVFDLLLDGEPHAAADVGVTWFAQRYGTRDARDVVELLEDHGLVEVDRNQQSVQLWLDVLVGWHGSLFPSWPSDPPVMPAPLDHPVATVPAAVGRLDRLLALWGRQPAPALRTGAIGTKAIKAAAVELDQPVGEVGLLANLAYRLGLLHPEEAGVSGRGRNRVVEYVWRPNADAAAFTRSSPVARWVELVRAWAQDGEMDDRAGLPNRVELQTSQPNREPAVERFLRELLALPAGTGLDAAALVDRLAFRAPALLPDARVHAFVAGARVLGLVPSSGPVGLTDGARTLLADPDRLAEVLPDTADRVIVQADLTVIAPPDLDTAVATLLEQFSQLESSAGARIYRITERSVRRGLAGGLDAATIVATLREHSAVDVPPVVTRLIDDVAAGHGRVRSGSATAYLVVEDPALLPAALKVRGARLRQVAPTVAVSDLPFDRVLAALRKAGVETVPDVEVDTASPAVEAPGARRRGRQPATVPDADAPCPPEVAPVAPVAPVLPGDAALRALVAAARKPPTPRPTPPRGRGGARRIDVEVGPPPEELVRLLMDTDHLTPQDEMELRAALQTAFAEGFGPQIARLWSGTDDDIDDDEEEEDEP